MGGCETKKLLHITTPYCIGQGCDFGCELDPHPNASVLVDAQQPVYHVFSSTHEVHIRNINDLFPDWADGIYDFTYSSHLIEHLVDPYSFLQECARLTKLNGHLIVVAPHEDWYWPNGHPNANPDHKWWHLNQRKIVKWLCAIGETYPLSIQWASEHGRDENNWSFVVVAKRVSEFIGHKCWVEQDVLSIYDADQYRNRE